MSPELPPTYRACRPDDWHVILGLTKIRAGAMAVPRSYAAAGGPGWLRKLRAVESVHSAEPVRCR